MNDAQTWTLIVGTLTVQVAIIGAVLALQTRWLRSEIARVETRFDIVDARFDTVLARLDHLDRDVQTVVNRMMGEGR